MKQHVFFNIYKNTTDSPYRTNRVRSILHPTYYVILSDIAGKDTLRKRMGLKLDTVFSISILPNSILEKTKKLKTKYRQKIYNYLLSELIGDSKYFGIHNILFPHNTTHEIISVKKWFHKNNITSNILLDELIHIESGLYTFFSDRRSVFSSSWEQKKSYKNHLDLYIYGTIDIRREKVKFLISEENVVEGTYEAPVFGVRYIFHLHESKDKNKLCSHLFYLENSGLKETFYCWIEDTLESYYPQTQKNHIKIDKKKHSLYNYLLHALSKAEKKGLLSNIYIRNKPENKNERHISGESESTEEKSYKKDIALMLVGLFIQCLQEAQKVLWNMTPHAIVFTENDKNISLQKFQKEFLPLSVDINMSEN